MNRHFAVTVSDSIGSKYYFFGKSIKRNIVCVVSAVFIALSVSLTLNIHQYNALSVSNRAQSDLNDELAQNNRINSSLLQTIQNYEGQILRINQEVLNIEQFSGIDVVDLEMSLEERVSIIGNYYNAKEATYTEIGDKVEFIEGMVGLDGGNKLATYNKENLSDRVDLAGISVSQNRILHDSIPTGFPLSTKVVTSHFGKRKHPVTKLMSLHKGVDIRAKTGTPIFAPADGVVQYANYSKISGKRIVLLHNYGFSTRYAHLDSMDVEVGDIIHKGDLIAQSGNTGRSNAPHLHYEIRYLNRAIDPKDFLNWEFGENEIFTQVRGIKWPSLISLINKQNTHQTLQLSRMEPNLVGKSQ